jgi:AraC-like DNA-binding protein
MTDWVRVRRDAGTGIETIRAHFEGHAYDPHSHEQYLVGVTEDGVQEFTCRRQVQRSTAGRVILMEPGEAHDGRAPRGASFRYLALYLPQAWLPRALGFRAPVDEDHALARAIHRAWRRLVDETAPRLAVDDALDRLRQALEAHCGRAVAAPAAERSATRAVRRARDLLHALGDEDPGLEELARRAGAASRFQLSRDFRAAFGLPPHAYLVQLRLAEARRRLASGETPATAAAAAGFADQSHLGRWFRRAYRMTPAAYRRACTDVPDRSRPTAR